MQTFRWGILATGIIAHKMAEALRDTPDAEVLAVASRKAETAEAFGKQWHIPRRYESYDALVEDKDVDIVYIATPHSHHYENMLKCLSAGKHVLCEKAFTLNARQAAECIALARENNLFLMEAMWMRFFPAMAKIRSWLQGNLLGDVRLVQADFCIPRPFNPKHRLFNPELGGGALLDLGIYPLSFTTMVLGFPQHIYSHAYCGQTGVDEFDAIMLVYETGAAANLTCSLRIDRPREAFIVGTHGFIKIHEMFFRPDVLTLQLPDREPEVLRLPFRSNGYVHEVEEVHACLREGRTESAIMPLQETLALMELMDGLRAEWGLAYPGEA